MAQRRKVPDFSPKKLPTQERSRATVDAIVTACTWLLAERGYAGVTTNRIAERAGVNISSLYEYFPGKEAVVTRVAERLVERVLGRLARGLGDVTTAGEDEVTRRWIELILATVAREKKVVYAFVYEVPFTNDIPAVRNLNDRLVEFSRAIQGHAGGLVDPSFSRASLHLVVNLVSSTILRLVLDPPRDVSQQELIDELVERLDVWIRGDGASKRR
jgi:AcrR family transcriptional regulator